MRKGLATTALIFGILGFLSGVNEWFLQIFVLELVNWEGPLQTLANLSWFLETVLISLAVILLAIAVLKRDPEEDYREKTSSPPPLPARSLMSMPPALESNTSAEWPKRERS